MREAATHLGLGGTHCVGFAVRILATRLQCNDRWILVDLETFERDWVSRTPPRRNRILL